MLRAYVALFAVVTASACGGQTGDGPVRSPTLDYPLPPSQTSDGEVVGADRQPPGDKLQEGAHAGTHGVIPSSGPGAPPEQASPAAKPRPCSEIGLEDASGQTRCKKPPAAQ
ncbi:MAG TPA: hypothetical protein VHU80_05250 [Polyangiaceae bacterium]|nr:hypothetical protein [Polyangiaceae bacterium]